MTESPTPAPLLSRIPTLPVLGTLLGSAALAGALAFGGRAIGTAVSDNGGVPGLLAGLLVAIAGVFVLVHLLLIRPGHLSWAGLGWKRVNGSSLWLALCVLGWWLLGLSAPLVVSGVIGVVSSPAAPAPAGSETGGVAAQALGQPALVLALGFIALTFLGPLAEEVLFRGVLYRYLRGYLRIWPAIMVQGVLFGVIHGVSVGLALLLVLGVGTGWLRQRFDSLIAPLALHAVNNGAVATLLLLSLVG